MSIFGQNGQAQHVKKNNEEKSRITLKNMAMYCHLTACMGMIHSFDGNEIRVGMVLDHSKRVQN